MMQPDPMGQCHGKQALTYAVAKRIVNKSGDRRVFYKCEVCGEWHVGTPSKAAMRSVKGKK